MNNISTSSLNPVNTAPKCYNIIPINNQLNQNGGKKWVNQM